MTRTRILGSTLLALSAFTAHSEAAALLLDFGNTSNVSTNANTAFRTDSPAFAGGGLSTSTTPSPTWNSPLTISDAAASSLKYVDGSTATGVAYDLAAAIGTTTVTPTAITFGQTSGPTQPANTLPAGGAITTGVYAPGKVASGGIFVSNSANNIYTVIGLRVSGLDLGEYDIYVTGRNTNVTSTVTQRLTAEATTSDTAYTLPAAFATMANTLTSGTGSVSTAAFIENDNYVKLRVNLTAANPFLTLTSRGAVPSEARGWLNSVEIVSVPEPAGFAVLLLGVPALMRRRKAR